MSKLLRDISVVIPTQNRAESLRITLECLASANLDGIRAEVIVVNNAGRDNTGEIVASFGPRIPLRYLYEPTLGVYGKSHALNRALDTNGLAEIIAVLDDDMSPHPDWFQGVMAICRRWPNKDLFTGHTYIIWPYDDVPRWAKKPRLQSWLFSAGHVSNSDSELEEGRWYLGGHFWFRSRILDTGRRFKDIWVTEPDFQLDLSELGFSGVSSRDAVAGHRIQPTLLQKDVALQRAKRTGVCAAWLRLSPYRRKVKQARLLHKHPWLGRIFCLLNHFRWRLLFLASYLCPSDDSRFEHRLIAAERMSTYLELFRTANRLGAYSLWKHVREQVTQSTAVPVASSSFSDRTA